jgi:phosphoglycerate dehydrogenase-like enzyme
MKLLYDAPVPVESLAEMRRVIPELDVVCVPVPTPAVALADADVLYTESARFDPAAAPKLKWVQTNSAATRGVWGTPVMSTGIPVCNCGGAYSVAVAECTFALLLALTRKVPQGVAAQRDHFWPSDYDPWLGVDLHGMTLGIIGYGSIGRQIARLGQGFGMKVLACKRRPDERREKNGYLIPGTGDPDGTIPNAWYGTQQIAELMAQSDAIVITLPEIPTTVKLIGATELAALKPRAWLINVGRGGVIDEPALIETLRAKKIAGAGLDVVAEEPLPQSSPLWDLPNVLIMPHIASWTEKQAHRSCEALIENLSRHQAGLPLVNVIDKKLLY